MRGGAESLGLRSGRGAVFMLERAPASARAGRAGHAGPPYATSPQTELEEAVRQFKAVGTASEKGAISASKRLPAAVSIW